MSSSRSLLVVVSLLSSVAAERYLRVADGARSADPTRKELYLGPEGNVPPSKSPSAGVHKPTWKPSSKPVEHAVHDTTTSSTDRPEGPAGVDGTIKGKVPPPSVIASGAVPNTKKTLSPPRQLAGPKDEKADPCHDGLSPRCTPPTSKPVEHRSLAGSPTKSPSSGLHKPTWKPSSKPAEHRRLAGTPTKSPSSGIHKPTWKPSSKPAEHRSLSGKTDKPSEKGRTNKPAEKATNQGAALPRQLSESKKSEKAKDEIKDLRADIKEDKKDLSKLSKNTDKAAVKTIKSEIKADKATIKDDKEVVINEETGRPNGLDEDGTIHAPKLGSKLGQVEGEVVPAASRKDAKSKTSVSVEAPADVDPTAVSVPMTYHANSKSAKNAKATTELLPPKKSDTTDVTTDVTTTDADVVIVSPAVVDTDGKKPSVNDPLRASAFDEEEAARKKRALFVKVALRKEKSENEITALKAEIKADEKLLEQMDIDDVKDEIKEDQDKIKDKEKDMKKEFKSEKKSIAKMDGGDDKDKAKDKLKEKMAAMKVKLQALKDQLEADKEYLAYLKTDGAEIDAVHLQDEIDVDTALMEGKHGGRRLVDGSTGNKFTTGAAMKSSAISTQDTMHAEILAAAKTMINAYESGDKKEVKNTVSAVKTTFKTLNGDKDDVETTLSKAEKATIKAAEKDVKLAEKETKKEIKAAAKSAKVEAKEEKKAAKEEKKESKEEKLAAKEAKKEAKEEAKKEVKTKSVETTNDKKGKKSSTSSIDSVIEAKAAAAKESSTKNSKVSTASSAAKVESKDAKVTTKDTTTTTSKDSKTKDTKTTDTTDAKVTTTTTDAADEDKAAVQAELKAELLAAVAAMTAEKSASSQDASTTLKLASAKVASSSSSSSSSSKSNGKKVDYTKPSRVLSGSFPEEKADPCHDGLSPRCTPPTSKPVEHRSLAGSPTKSPSSGLHKPTWRPSSKPNEHRALSGKTDKPSEKGRTNKPAEKATNQGAALPRNLAAVRDPKDEKADPCHDGLSPRCTPPTSKPVEHRSLAGSPTKSPSSGLHKPTWRPSSKPNEHRRLSKADKEAANDAKHGSDKLSKKESKKIIEKKADQLEDKKSQLKKAALSTNKDKISADRQLKSLKDKKEELKAFQAAQLADSEDVPSIYFESEVDPAYSFSSKFAASTTTNKSERDAKKADSKTKAKVAEVESVKASKGEVKQDVEKAAALQAIELKGEIKSLELKTAAKEEEIAANKATLKEAMSAAVKKLSATTSSSARKSASKKAEAAEKKVIKAEKKELKSEKKELKSAKKELKTVKTMSSDQQKMTAWLAKAYASSSEGKENAHRRLHSLKALKDRMEEFETQYDTVMKDKAFSAASSSAKLGGSIKVDGEDVSVQELNDLYTGIKDFEKDIKTDLSKGDISQHKYSDTVERLEAIKATAKLALKENDRNVKADVSNHMTDGVQDKNAKKEAKGKLTANEGRKLAGPETKDEKADPCHDGLSPRCTPPTSKPVEHRSLAGSPTKSPSSGLHKPTWRPSSKPAEHRAVKQ